MNPRSVFLFIGAAVLILSTLNYWSAFDNSFRDDDFYYLDLVTKSDPLYAAFAPHDGFTFYRPGLIGLFDLEFAAFRLNGGLYIMTNYLIHLINSLLMLAVLMRLGLRRSVSVLASSLYLFGFCHYGKQITWACSSGPLASQTLALAALLLGVLWRSGEPHGIDPKPVWAGKYYPLAIVALFTVAAFFHEAVLTIPILILFLAAGYGFGKLPDYVKVAATAFIPIIVWRVLLRQVYAYYPSYRTMPDFDVGLVSRLFRYVGFMLFPVQESVSPMLRSVMLDWLIKIAVPIQYGIAAVFMGLSIWMVLRRSWRVGFLSLWVLAGLLPFTVVPMPGARLELRYVYAAGMPMSALFALVVVRLFEAKRRLKRTLAIGLCVAAVLGTSVLMQLLERKYDKESQLPPNSTRFEDINSRVGP